MFIPYTRTNTPKVEKKPQNILKGPKSLFKSLQEEDFSLQKDKFQKFNLFCQYSSALKQ